MSDITDGRAESERLWNEHGWGLRGWQVALLVGTIIAASAVMHLIG